MPIDCLNSNGSFVLSHNLVTNGRNFIKIILKSSAHSAGKLLKCCQGVINHRGVIALQLLPTFFMIVFNKTIIPDYVGIFQE